MVLPLLLPGPVALTSLYSPDGISTKSGFSKYLLITNQIDLEMPRMRSHVFPLVHGLGGTAFRREPLFVAHGVLIARAVE